MPGWSLAASAAMALPNSTSPVPSVISVSMPTPGGLGLKMLL